MWNLAEITDPAPKTQLGSKWKRIGVEAEGLGSQVGARRGQ